MRGFSVPTLAGAIVAAFSLIYFSAASHWVGDEALSMFVVAMAEVSIVQAVLIPRTWLYVVSGQEETHSARISTSMAMEAAGGSLGLFVLLAYCTLRGLSADALYLRLIVYFSLWVPSLTSATGAYRSSHRWMAYFFWIAGSSLLRFPVLAAISPYVDQSNGDPARNIVWTALLSYLGPELVRFAAGYLPLVWRHYRRPSRKALQDAFRQVSANWRFDVGSTLTDSLDKIIVGALFSPQVLVAYFFARRIAGAIPMVLEPFYAHIYQQRIESRQATIDTSFLWSNYARGLGISASLALTVVAVFLVGAALPSTARYLPAAVVSQLALFALVLGLDAVFCANRWYRYVSQHQGATLLFAIRLASFLMFFLVARQGLDLLSPPTPFAALASALVLDTVGLVYLITRATSHTTLALTQEAP